MSPRRSSGKGRAGPASKKKVDAPRKRKAEEEESDEDHHEENGEDSDAAPSPKKTPQKKVVKKGKGKKKAKAPEKPKKKDEAGDESEEDDKEYEVESVLDVELNRAGEPKNFLVKWVGYPRKDATWEPADQLGSAEEKVSAFMAKLDKLKSSSNNDERLRTQRKQTKPYQDSVRNAGVRASRRFASKPRTTYHGQED